MKVVLALRRHRRTWDEPKWWRQRTAGLYHRGHAFAACWWHVSRDWVIVEWSVRGVRERRRRSHSDSRTRSLLTSSSHSRLLPALRGAARSHSLSPCPPIASPSPSASFSRHTPAAAAQSAGTTPPRHLVCRRRGPGSSGAHTRPLSRLVFPPSRQERPRQGAPARRRPDHQHAGERERP